MRVFKILLALLVFVLVVAGILAWTLPADVGYRYGTRYLGPVALTGISGTVWNGHADGVSVFGHDIGELDWHASKGPLLHGQFVADVRIKGAGVDVAGELARSAGMISARDLRFSMPAALLAPVLDIGTLKLLGTISGVVNQATLANAMLRDASGNARWSDAGVAGQAEARFSDILAEFASQPDGSVAGTLRDDGQGTLAVDGTFKVRFATTDAQARLSARNGDAQITEALRYIGEPQPDGSTKLVVHGQILKVL
ncbi:type II secretion system protein N [Dokdonella soli]|uniref:Type II secretion system protein N n=1 Tax=Dokdonella soli TaxID=529810 RepID=A0ABN1IVU0_9GAMM